ncbi:hypothetical protein Unana1_06207 [Umbelopsis nana]
MEFLVQRRPPRRQYVQSLQARVKSLESILNSIVTCGDDQLLDFVRGIRENEDIISNIPSIFTGEQNVGATSPNAAASDVNSVKTEERDVSPALLDALGQLTGTLMSDDGEMRYHGSASSLHLERSGDPKL